MSNEAGSFSVGHMPTLPCSSNCLPLLTGQRGISQTEEEQPGSADVPLASWDNPHEMVELETGREKLGSAQPHIQFDCGQGLAWSRVQSLWPCAVTCPVS